MAQGWPETPPETPDHTQPIPTKTPVREAREVALVIHRQRVSETLALSKLNPQQFSLYNRPRLGRNQIP
jgi:hypothetical protein